MFTLFKGRIMMANRVRPIEEKIHAVSMVLDKVNTNEIARLVGIPESTLRYDLGKVRKALPIVLTNKKPGPLIKDEKKNHNHLEDNRPHLCPKCGHNHIWKNGTYWVFNWLAMLLISWLPVKRILILRIALCCLWLRIDFTRT